jgi:hypothetical protein
MLECKMLRQLFVLSFVTTVRVYGVPTEGGGAVVSPVCNVLYFIYME